MIDRETLNRIGTMNKRPSKKQLRAQLNQDVTDFLSHGGEVNEFQRGRSGLENGHLDERRAGVDQPKQTRPLLDSEMQAVDARKKPKAATKPPSSNRPKKKIIYDDFGEPVREVWVD